MRIAVSCILQDSGEATRAIEICKALARADPGLDIVFISRGSSFEERIKAEGWRVHDALPRMSGIGLHQDLKMRDGEIIGDTAIAESLLRGEAEAYGELRPDIVLYGFWPVAGITRKIANPPVPGVCFLPLPLSENFIRRIDYFPESAGILGAAPRFIQRAILSALPYAVKARNPGFAHSILDRAASRVFGGRYRSSNIVGMLDPGLMLVNDIAEHYGPGYPERVKFSGPVFSEGGKHVAIEAGIERVLGRPGKKVFCTLGSSGTSAELEEIVKAMVELPLDEYGAVVLCPKSVADIDHFKSSYRVRDNVVLTDAFVPAKRICELCDIVLCHGGQGTVQTAISSGVPVVGVPMQAEQDMNLERLSRFGAGVKIPRRRWKAEEILRVLRTVDADCRYAERARELKRIYGSYGGAEACASEILSFASRVAAARAGSAGGTKA